MERRRAIAANYKTWSTEQLEHAYGQDRDQYEPLALEVMAEELKTRRLTEQWMCPECGFLNPAGATECANQSSHEADAAPLPQPGSPAAQLGPDERKCPTCAEIIKRDALKCRFCGQVLSADVYGGNTGLGSYLNEEVPQPIIHEIESAATQGMWFGIASLFCCAPVTGPMGISNGNKAIRLLEQYPAYEGRSSARGKARAGQIIGWIGLIGFVISIIVRLSQ
jgi:predicted RNA-binding Zn-ribbon protein involved in translation (DUF1610 family)